MWRHNSQGGVQNKPNAVAVELPPAHSRLLLCRDGARNADTTLSPESTCRIFRGHVQVKPGGIHRPRDKPTPVLTAGYSTSPWMGVPTLLF